MTRSRRKRVFASIFLILVVIGGIIAFTVNTRLAKNGAVVPSIAPQKSVSDAPYEITYEGDVVCLPPRDTSGPQTLECAYGLMVDTDLYYALDAGEVELPPYKIGDRIVANGIVTPVQNLSSDHWQKYTIQGIFSIKDSLKIL